MLGLVTEFTQCFARKFHSPCVLQPNAVSVRGAIQSKACVRVRLHLDADRERVEGHVDRWVVGVAGRRSGQQLKHQRVGTVKHERPAPK